MLSNRRRRSTTTTTTVTTMKPNNNNNFATATATAITNNNMNNNHSSPTYHKIDTSFEEQHNDEHADDEDMDDDDDDYNETKQPILKQQQQQQLSPFSFTRMTRSSPTRSLLSSSSFIFSQSQQQQQRSSCSSTNGGMKLQQHQRRRQIFHNNKNNHNSTAPMTILQKVLSIIVDRLSYISLSTTTTTAIRYKRNNNNYHIPYMIFIIGCLCICIVFVLNLISMILYIQINSMDQYNHNNNNNRILIPFWTSLSYETRRTNAKYNNLRSYSNVQIVTQQQQAQQRLYPSVVQLHENDFVNQQQHQEQTSHLYNYDYTNRYYRMYVHVPIIKKNDMKATVYINTNQKYYQYHSIPDYNNIIIKHHNQKSNNQENDIDEYEIYRQNILDTMDVIDMSYYYEHYDDINYSIYNEYINTSTTTSTTTTTPNDIIDNNTNNINPKSQQSESKDIPYNNEFNVASCERPKWGYDTKLNCNVIHEIQSLYDGLIHTNTIQILGHGYYRDTYLIQNTYYNNNNNSNKDHNRYHTENVVMKHLRYEHLQNQQYYYEMNIEAMIMEQLTHSNVITNIYSHCGTTIIVESLQDVTHTIVPYNKIYQPLRGRVSNVILQQLEHEQYIKNNHIGKHDSSSITKNSTSTTRDISHIDKSNSNDINNNSDPYSFNNLTIYEKLHYAIQMSQGLMEMHGYNGGVIVHDDVHPDQWLLSLDGKRLVLNDMNNAVILQWSRQYNTYCTYWDQYSGDYRAPELYQPNGYYMTNESADIYPMGYLIYSLITGLYPYFNITNGNEEMIQQLAINNVELYLHPKLRNTTLNYNHHYIHNNVTTIDTMNYNKSTKQMMDDDHDEEDIIYSRLIYIMDQCLHIDPNQRPSIFDVYQYLIKTQEMMFAIMNRKKH